MKLKGKTALVTGASTGIGRAIAVAIAAHGGRVGLVARSIKGLEETRESIRGLGGEARIFSADLISEDAINVLWADVAETWGRVDILVNAAGVWHGKDSLYLGSALQDTPPEEINLVLDVQLRAPILLSRLVLPGMIQQKSGKILNISAEVKDPSGWIHYYVSKKALEDFTVGLAEEVRDYEIQVNCIAPADTLSENYCKFFPNSDPKCCLKTSDVAEFAIFLLSDDSNHITGSITILRNKAAGKSNVTTADLLAASGEAAFTKKPGVPRKLKNTSGQRQ